MRSVFFDIGVGSEYVVTVFDASHKIVAWCAKQQANFTRGVTMVYVQARFVLFAYCAFTLRQIFKSVKFFSTNPVVEMRAIIVLAFANMVCVLLQIRFELLPGIFSPFEIGRCFSSHTFWRLLKMPSVVTTGAHSTGLHFPIGVVDADLATSSFSSHE